MWLQLSQVLKKIHRRKREKTSICFLRRRHKNPKNTRGSGFTRESSSLAHAYGS